MRRLVVVTGLEKDAVGQFDTPLDMPASAERYRGMLERALSRHYPEVAVTVRLSPDAWQHPYSSRCALFEEGSDAPAPLPRHGPGPSLTGVVGITQRLVEGGTWATPIHHDDDGESDAV